MRYEKGGEDIRYITDDNNIVKAVSVGSTIECYGKQCTEYEGDCPSGYASLDDWFCEECGNLDRWKVINGQLSGVPIPSEIVAGDVPIYGDLTTHTLTSSRAATGLSLEIPYNGIYRFKFFLTHNAHAYLMKNGVEVTSFQTVDAEPYTMLCSYDLACNSGDIITVEGYGTASGSSFASVIHDVSMLTACISFDNQSQKMPSEITSGNTPIMECTTIEKCQGYSVYRDTNVKLTIAKNGTYTFKWLLCCGMNDNDVGSQLKKNGTVVTTISTSNSVVGVADVNCSAGDEIMVTIKGARKGSTQLITGVVCGLTACIDWF